ncbi:sigma-70 family RNA polymerase sigma factor [Hirschia litorea]|uniref:Sigma-70 family RNA polymerase sigma factor n=1 Tax=Hirschia litorea TaxID=1199156 RepID=A0ABW2INX6_9PROT
MASEIDTLDEPAFKAELTSLIPHLRAFAKSLCGNAAMADDLAQETMLKAWRARDRYEADTNMKAWCFTILRNLFYSEKRRDWRGQSLDPEVAEATLVANDKLSDTVELLELRNAMNQLPDDQRECLIMVGAGGLSYEEVAEICDCAVGTIKSRVSRARKALLELVEGSQISGFPSKDDLEAHDAFDDILDQADQLIGTPPVPGAA